MAMDMTPLHNKACIQSWNKTLVGGKCPWRLGSAKIAWLLYVIPVACSHFLKALAVSVDFLAVILDQDDQISVSVAKSNWLTLVKELTSIISMSSSSSWLVLATKTFLQRLQNLDPESPLMEKQYLWAAPSMIQKPIFIYKRLYGIGLHQLDACLACADDLVHQHFHELAHVGCHIVHLGTSNDAECDPTGGGLQMRVEFLEAVINGPCLS